MSNSNDHANNYDSEMEPPYINPKDSTKKQRGDDDDVDIVEDVINVQSGEAGAGRIDSNSTSEAEVEDEASDVQSLLTSVPQSPPPSDQPPSSPPPPRRTHHRRASLSGALPPPHTPPHHPMPSGTFMMPAGFVPPPMFMPPPPPHFQFFPYGQPYMPYSYTQIPHYNYPRNPWLTGPFDCFSDAKNCCLTCCCPCVTFGQITEILNEGQTPWWEHAAGYLVLESITFSVGTFLYAWPYRVKMRTKFWLRGKLLWDLIFTFFCTRVSLCQQYRQLCRLGLDVPLGWEANREKMRMKALENMYRMHNRQVTPPVIELGMYR